MDYLEHGRTFPNQRVNAGPDQSYRTSDHPREGALLHVTRPEGHPQVLIIAHPQFRKGKEHLLWSYRNGRRDLGLFVACLTGEGSSTSSWRDASEVYDLLVDTDTWQIPADTLHDALTQQPGFETNPQLRALFCELFPNDERSRTMFADLEAWFRADDHRERREWIDTLAVAVRSSTPDVLPSIVTRAHQQILLRDAVNVFPLLTGPLLRRLHHDGDAVNALRSAIQDPASADTSTPIWAQAPGARQTRDPEVNTQQVYVLSTVLNHAGLLDESTATIARSTLTATNSDVVVHDPFSGAERPARAAAVSVSRHL